MITLMVNSGIGDMSWLFAKLDRLSKEKEIQFSVARDRRERGRPFIEMHPRIKIRNYGNFGDDFPMKQTMKGDTELSKLKDDCSYPLSVNQWLIDGRKIEDWLPSEPINFKYELNFNEEDKRKATELLVPGVKIGIYGSCYSILRHWNFWKEIEWMQLIEKLAQAYPEATFYVIGAEFDIDLGENIYRLICNRRIKTVKVIGKPLGVALSVIKNLDYFFGFPSGLPIVANALNTPTMMFMPPHLEQMIYNFTPKEDNESGLFINVPFIDPQMAFEMFKAKGADHMEKRISLATMAASS